MARARTNVETIAESITADLAAVRAKLDLTDPETDKAWAGIETMCTLALRVFAKTNPSKIRSEMLTVELHARTNGVPIADE